MKNRRGFTLIELLVVVAIIALLIALLMPSLAKAKEEAKLTRCLSNMHAIAIALGSYNASNSDLMPEGQEFKWGPMHTGPGVPNPNNPWTWPTSTADDRLTLIWTDALYIDGDFKQWTDQGGNGVQQDTNGSHYNNGWSMPTCGYGILQCPNHRPENQFGADDRINQCYGLAWAAASYFAPATDNAGNVLSPYRPAYSSVARNLNPNHITVAEGDAEMSTWPQGGTSNPPLGLYKLYQRHYRDGRKSGTGSSAILLGGTYLMADGHAEWSSLYATYPSPSTVNVPGGGNPAIYYSPSTPTGAKPPHDIWAHP